MKIIQRIGWVRKDYWIAFAVSSGLSVIWYLVVNREIRNIFHPDSWGEKLLLFAYCAVGFLVLTGFLFSIYYFVRNRKKHQRFVKYFLIYFSFMFLMLLIGWPGIFRGDEFYTIRTVTNMGFEYGQHYFTSLFYAVSLAIIPTLAGIVFVQIVVISAIVAYVLGKIEGTLKHKKLTYLLLVVFVLPPVVDANLFTLRATLAGYLVLLMICQLMIYSNDRNKKRLYYIGVLCVIFACWKSEFLYIPVMVVMYLLIFYRKNLNLKRFGCVVAGFVVLFVVLGLPQKNLKHYLMTLVVNPLSLVAHAENVEQSVPDDVIKDIEAIVSFDTLRKYATHQDVWPLSRFRADYTDKEEKAFYVAYVRLMLANPIEFIRARGLTYEATNFPDINEWPNHTGHEDPDAQWTLDLSGNTYLKDNFRFTDNLFGEGFKKSFVSFLQMRNDEYKPTILQPLFYNSLIPTVGAFVIMIAAAVRKRFKEAFIILMILCQCVLVFLTAPANFWMYYFCVYLLGYLVIMYALIKCIDWWKGYRYNKKEVEKV